MTPQAQAVAAASAAIEAAAKSRDADVAAATKRFNEATSEAHGVLRQLHERYAETAFELACDARSAPFSRSGSPLRPDDSSVTEEGIDLHWYADCGPDAWFTATWEDLSNYLETQHHD
jgi:hypothetical protein